MSKNKELKKNLCWNCYLEIIGESDKCPECGVTLNPNEYVPWNFSWHLFLFILCIIPFSIALIIFYFY